MAMAMWAKTAAGTNLAFVKGFGKALKTWKDVLQKKIIGKAPPKYRLHHEVQIARIKERYFSQPPFQTKRSDRLLSRIFRSLFNVTTNMNLAHSARAAMSTTVRNGSTGFRYVPLLSLIGVTMGLELDQLIDRSSEKVMSDMKNLFQDYGWESEPLSHTPGCLNDLDIVQHSIANGCEGAVYKAKIKEHKGPCEASKDEDYDLAVKAVFNYGADSNAGHIMRELAREMVPLNAEVEDLSFIRNGAGIGSLPPHPNIVDMPGIFVDDVLVTEDALQNFPAALPRSVNPDLCYGRNKTLYLVMRRRSTHLGDYLSTNDASMATRCLILAQVLEGVAHLVHHGIAHRDLKTNNILVAVPKAGGPPKIEICDFGCCLAEEDKSLHVAFPSRDLFIGGNTWLMAPEIASAQPGPFSMLDFRKADAWAVGALAYEILGADNPFYPCKDPSKGHTQLSSRTYSQEELPPLPEAVPRPVQDLIRALLCRDPAKRPSASVAATVMHMVVMEMNSKGQGCFDGKTYHSSTTRGRLAAQMAKEREMLQGVLVQSLSLLCQLVFVSQKEEDASWDVSSVLRFLFLSRLNYHDFRSALKFF